MIMETKRHQAPEPQDRPTSEPARYDVAIVGYGPVGATLANLLGQAGLSVLVLEREPGVYHQPRAGHFDGEVMRVFQGIDLADEIAARTFVSRGMKFVDAQGRLLLDWSRPMEPGPQGWHVSYRFHQPYLEQSLRTGAARFPGVDVRLRCDAYAIGEEGDRVAVRYEDLASGQLVRASARYVVGCDGARSTVRRFMDVALEDLRSHERWVIVDVKMKAEKPGLEKMTVQLCDPARPTTLIQMVENRRRFELMLMPGDDPAEIVRHENVWRLLSRWIAPGEAEIERAVVYTFHSVVARRWRVGRMLLAGDACHQTPPFMGQGMCAGIRDVSNLAWKLDWVLKGRAGEALLDTYQSERSPHVRAYIETAVRLGSIIQATDPEVARRRDEEMLRSPAKMESIQPALGPGLHGDAAPPAGMLSAQPKLADGRRLDDAIGPGFAVVCAKSFPARAPAGVQLVVDGGPEVEAWLAKLGAEAVVVRPDRYVLGAANSVSELEALCHRIPTQ
jgi:3-(3-hydroxy-phenyl)propionate hydroxylase